MSASASYVAFQSDRLIARGVMREVAEAVRAAPADAPVLVFDEATGSQTDLGPAEVRPTAPEAPRGRGRPKLGVVAREVTLLPRHWDWLSSQPGGASVVLRKLVEEASRSPKQRARAAANAAYAFLHAIAGNRPGYEDALRALFAGDRAQFEERMAPWPADIRAFALHLAYREEAQ